MQVDHEVAVGSNALADLFQRPDHLWNARTRVEQRAANAIGRGGAATARSRPTARAGGAAATARAPPTARARSPGSSRPRARQDAAVDAIDPPAGGHRRRRALFEAHALRLFLRDDALRQTVGRVQLDVVARL